MERKLMLIGSIAVLLVLLGGKYLFDFEPSESVRDGIDALMMFILTVVTVRDWDRKH